MVSAKANRNPRDWQEEERGNRFMPAQREQRDMRDMHESMPAQHISYFGPLSHFLMDMDRMFDNVWRNFGLPANFNMPMPGLGMSTIFQPKINVTSNDREYTITAELPGVDERDVRVSISSDGMLTISGEKKQEYSEIGKDVQRSEFSYGVFERSLYLPDDIDPEGIEARFRNGLLITTAPKTETGHAQSRQIPVSGGGFEGGRLANAPERGGPERGVPERGGQQERGGAAAGPGSKKAA